MRLVSLLFIYFLSLNANAQWNYREDTLCYSTQKIVVPYFDLHDGLVVDFDQKNDLFHYVYLMNREQHLEINTIQETERPILPYMDEIERGLHNVEPLHKYFDYEMNKYVYAYELIIYPDILYDEWGEPISRYNDSGELEYVWGNSDSIIYTFYSISDVILTYYKSENWEGELEETRYLSFVMTGVYGDKRKIFTISFDKFMKKMSEYLINKRVNLPWYQKLVDDTFKAYRFYQIPCGSEISEF